MKRLLLTAALLTAFAAPLAAAPVTYKIDPNHTDVTAQWSHFGFSNPIAHFGDVEGAITYDPDNVGQSSVEVTLPLSGLEAHVPAFNEHLRSDDFFDAASTRVLLNVICGWLAASKKSSLRRCSLNAGTWASSPLSGRVTSTEDWPTLSGS